MDLHKIMFAIDNRCLYLKMMGAIRHTLCASLDILIRNLIEQSTIDKFVIDLRPAVYLDSTSLGLIARMARHMKTKTNEKIVLISTNADVNEILSSVQFGSIANIVDTWENLPEPFYETELFAEQVQAHREMIIKSHQELAKINEDNRKKFTAVIKSLEKKYQKEK
ncbi:MAG: STAS domain-containing protein [Calditrichaceae bacterium]|nr:STAS domain-containing protein [Calditrichaceae bacterium]HES59304.1 anti-sigma factor antagonist [Caldithrix sp.]